MKKFFAIFLLTFFSLNIFVNNSFSYEENKNTISKNIVLTKTKLEKSVSGKKYLKAIDYFVKEKDNNSLKKVQKKISELLTKTTFEKNSETLSIIMYLKYKIDYKLSEELTVEDLKNEDKSETKKEVQVSKLTDSEKQKVKTEILKIQSNLLDSSEHIITKLKENLEENLNTEEQGDFDLKLKIDHKDFGNLDYKLYLEDYIAKSNSNLDASFKGDLKSLLYYNLKSEENGKLDFNGIFEQISKDGKNYIGIKNFHVSEKEGLDENVEKFLEKLEKISSENKFINITGEEDKNVEIVNFIRSMNPKNFLNKVSEFKKEPLFEAYRKTEDKYLLQPTKFACEKIKELSDIFDPFYGVNCNDEQYNQMIKGIKEIGDFYLKIGKNENTFGFKGDPDDAIIVSEIIYDSTKVNKLSFLAQPKDEKYSGEYIGLEYIAKDSLNFGYKIDGSNLKFESKLDTENKFKYIDVNLSDEKQKNKINLKLENNIINGSFEFIETGYNYKKDNWKIIDKYKVTGKITGNTKADNSLKDLYINIERFDLLENKNDLKANISINENLVKFSLNSESEGEKADLDISYNYDENYLPLNGSFKLNVWEKESSYDYESYKTLYSGDFKKVLTSDINISSREIEGTTKFIDYMTIEHNGWISHERFELENIFTAEKKFIKELNESRNNKKRRDSSRKFDLKKLDSAITMYHTDEGKYPNKEELENEEFKDLIYYIPKDPSGNVEINNCKFGYKYEYSENFYKLSACLEGEEKVYELGNYGNNFVGDESIYINGYENWTKKEEEKFEEIQTLNGNLQIKVETANNQNNFSINFFTILDNEEIIKFEMKNDSSIIKKEEVYIQAPKNYIDIEDLIK